MRANSKNQTLAHKLTKMLMLIAKLLAMLSAYLTQSDTKMPPSDWNVTVSHTNQLYPTKKPWWAISSPSCADFGVSIAHSRRKWSCKIDSGSKTSSSSSINTSCNLFSMPNRDSQLRNVRTTNITPMNKAGNSE